MRKSGKRVDKRGGISLLILLSTVALATAKPLDTLFTDKVVSPSEALDWQLLAADDALASGLISIAESFYSGLLSRTDLTEHQRHTIALKLCSVWINQGRFSEGQQILESHALKRGSAYFLRSSLVAFALGKFEASAGDLNQIDPQQLSTTERPWYEIIKGLLAEQAGLIDEAHRAFAVARELSHSEQRTYIERFLIRNRLTAGQASEQLLQYLENKVHVSREQPGVYPFIYEYVIALERLGRREAALDVIQEQLSALPEQESLKRDRLLSLQGLIVGAKHPRGISALKRLLQNGVDIDLQQAALYSLANSVGDAAESKWFRDYLKGLIDPSKNHPLLDELLYVSAYLAVQENLLEEAQRLLDHESTGLIQQFPGSSFADQALWLLAFIAWSREVPQYRIAANYLTRLRNRLPEGDKKTRLNALIADCYFLNGDFKNAADAYGAALATESSASSQSRLLFQQVLSEIRADRLNKAVEHLAETKVALQNRWAAEWQLINAFKDNDQQLQAALDRIRYLLQQSSDQQLPTQWRVRLLWFEIQLLQKLGQIRKTLSLADILLDLLTILPEETFPSNQKDRLTAHTLLVKGEALLENPDTAKLGIQILRQIRQRYPSLALTVQSYLIESRYWTSINRLVDAQQLLVQLADTYPDSELAPVALYEAALNADLRGLATTCHEALELLERLSAHYPKNLLAFYARLKQGDILRNLNKFGEARHVYEILVQHYPNHPELYRAELYIADCFLAQAAQDESRLETAIAHFERLFDLPHLPTDLRVEAGYKWAYALGRKKQLARAQVVYWSLIVRFLKDPELSLKLGGTGRYWMARAILELGALLEPNGSAREMSTVYRLILDYNLPGQSLAKDKLQQLFSQSPATFLTPLTPSDTP